MDVLPQWLTQSWQAVISQYRRLTQEDVALLSAIVGALVGAVATPIVAYLFRSFFTRLEGLFRRRIFPLISGAFLLDRYLGLPRYLKNLERSLELLRHSWLTDGPKLADILVPVSVAPGSGKERRPDDSRDRAGYGTSLLIDRKAEERYDLRSLFDRFRWAVLVGDPGSGKSTALKAIALNCLRDRDRAYEQYVPVIVSLRAWSLTNLSLMDHIAEIFEAHDFPSATRMIRSLRRTGRLVFLLDGLDEVDEQQRPGMNARLRKLLDEEARGAGCHVYITSRSVGYSEQLGNARAETVRMLDFTPAQMHRFISTWRFQSPKSAAHLFRMLSTRRAIFAICRNPLMLTIVTWVYGKMDSKLPALREEFFDVCIEALLGQWARVNDQAFRNRFPPVLKRMFLQEFAFSCLDTGETETSASAVVERLHAFLAQRDHPIEHAEALLEEIVQGGLLGRLPTGGLYFSHRTFAESLAARHARKDLEQFAARWSDRSEAWLEVCSLVIADPQTSLIEIERMLDAAIARDDWSGFLILAGEAHTCPDKYTAAVERQFQDRARWYLDKRPIAALARFGDVGHRVLAAMLHEEDAAVRQRALYALGQSTQPWARALILEATADEKTRRAVADALAGLGDEAVAILNDLVDSHHAGTCGPEVALACIETARLIGTPPAFQTIAPLVYHGGDVGVAATRASLAMLKQADVRPRFEAGELSLRQGMQPAISERELHDWALPWLRRSPPAVWRHASTMVNAMAGTLMASGGGAAVVELLKDVPYDYAIAILVQAPQDTQREWLGGIGEATPVSTAVAMTLLAERGPQANRELWWLAHEPEDRHVSVSGAWSIALVLAVALIGVLVPTAFLVAATWNAWWLAPYGVTALALGVMGLCERERWSVYLAPLFAPTAWALIRNLGRAARWPALHAVCVLIVVVSLMLTLAVAVLGALRLGPIWVACPVATALVNVPHLRLRQRAVILMRRINPLRQLVADTDTDADATPTYG